MKDVITEDIDYAKASEILKKYLGLSGSPVAVKLAKSPDELPEGIEEIGEEMRHCQMVLKARNEGDIFYATAKRHLCMGGAWAIGLRELTGSLKSGEFYYKLGKFGSWASSLRTMQQVPHVHLPGELAPPTHATVYAPLEKTPFDPHVIVIFGQPRMMLKLAQALLYRTGGRLNFSMAGIQSVCADTVALPYMTGAANFSMGCDGSRKFSGIPDDEMVMGFPAEMLTEVADAVQTVTGAPGSV